MLFVAVWIVWGGLALEEANAQFMRLGRFDVNLSVGGGIGYESNVDGSYPEEEDPNREMGDFYWRGTVNLSAAPVALRPNTTLSLAGGVNLQDYFDRSDSDTLAYNASANLAVQLPPSLQFTGLASAEYTADGETDDTYRPGGYTRDPTLTLTADGAVMWNWRQLRAEGRATFTREEHDKEEYWLDDNDETVFFAAIYWDVFSWGSIYYSWERTETVYPRNPEGDTTETVKNFGLQGAIPLSWIRHPQISYSLGIESEESDADPDKDATWEPTHTITAVDTFQINRVLRLDGSATWERAIYDDEISFVYSFVLTHEWGNNVTHSLSFEQEPKKTFGSNLDTKTTTYAYNMNIRNFFLRGLSAGFAAEHAIDEPLGVEDPLIEYTTTLTLSFSHSKQFSRRLSRTASYNYTWENSNFHDDGAKEEHVIEYGFNYVF